MQASRKKDNVSQLKQELAQKNRELKIEAALEKVRVVAMGMKEPADMPDICRVISKELQGLGIKSIRNIQTAIIDEEKASYLNYEYFRLYRKKIITVVAYQEHKDVNAFVKKMLRDPEGFFTKTFKGAEIKDWMKFQAKAGQFVDPQLKKTQSLHYYFYSIGPGALGISTYAPLTREEIILFKRFRNVFQLAYQRFIDIQKAETRAYEARIEASLEKVRAQALNMYKPADLLNVCKVLYKELLALGFTQLRNAIIHAFNDEEGQFTDYDYSDFSGGAMTRISYHAHPVIKKFIRQIKSSDKAFVEFKLTGNDLLDWKKFRVKSGQPEDPRLTKASTVHYYIYSVGSASIGISAFDIINEEKLELLRRFRNVFDFAYRRYMDVAQAEAQAREVEIQLALERVRARTMAMQSSNDLPQAANLLFQQIQSLGMPAWSAGYCTWDEDKKAITLSMSSEGVIQPTLRMPLTKDPSLMHFREAWERGESFFVEEVSGEELKRHYAYLRTLPGVKETLDDIEKAGFPVPTFQIFHLAYFSKGFLLFITYEPVPEAHDIFKRFANVFDQTYTRFLDLQKAEAQAREAQIELSLERVRARTMAMHKSDELNEVNTLMIQQIRSLDIRLYAFGIHICHANEPISEAWMGDPVGGYMPKVIYDHSQDPLSVRMYSGWKKGETLIVEKLEGEALKEHFEYMITLVPDRSIFDNVVAPGSLVFHFAYFTYGFFVFLTQEHCPKEYSFMKRLAKVFEQTYTRFLDLQKAEAQTREAMIEAALERVRSKAMAMHRSEDLHEAVAVVFEELEKLNLGVTRCGIGILNEKKRTGDIWITAETDEGRVVQVSGDESFDIHPLHKGSFEAWLKQEDFYYKMRGQEINEYYKAISPSDLRLPQSQMILSPTRDDEEQHYYVSTIEAGGLYAFKPTAFSDEAIRVMKRFASVFNLTYRRFLELQKAEAQATEAKIEASLERIRARTMAMHSSQDVGETVAAMFDEFLKLGIETYRCGIGIMHDTGPMEVWTARPGVHGKVDLIIGSLDMTIHPLFQGALKGWKNKEESFSYHLEGADLISYYKKLNSQPDYPVKYDLSSLPSGLFHNDYYFREGSLFVFSLTPLSAETSRILKRFAAVFGQTYRRYLDLLKAEAQAREAQIEAALERVRAKAMGMHKTEDFNPAVETMFHELQKLNLGMQRCGIGILNKEKRSADVWITAQSDEGTTMQISGDESLDIHPLLKGAFKAWLRHEDFSYVLEGKDLEDYYSPVGKIILPQTVHAVPGNLQQYYHFASFESGGLFAFRDTAFSDEAKKVMKRFIGVFDLTYKRFLDLQKAEAQAREARIEASLERVRSKAMAMHSSEDLATTVDSFFTELLTLDVVPHRCGVSHIDGDTGIAHITATTATQDGDRKKVVGDLSLSGHPLLVEIFEKWKEQEDLYPVLRGNEIGEYYKVVNPQLPVASFPDDEVQYGYYLYFPEGCVFGWTDKQLSEKELDIFRRFTSVLSLTYRRYNDLKKAEAQAREAQIEAALERVRAKAMAMHNSNDLTATAGLVFTELRRLDINPVRCGVSLQTKESRKNLLYYAIPSEEGDNLSLAGTALLDGHPVLSEVYDSWIRNEDYFPVLKGQSLSSYYQILKQVGFDVPASPADHEQYGYYLPFSEGMFYGWAEKPFTESEIKILKRFASVIDLTFRRYIELQKSEANAREAVKQSALDRLRAEIASMRTITDLNRITPLVWNELTILSVPFIRCGVFIMDDSRQLIHTFLSTPDGKAIAAFHLPYHSTENISQIVAHWRQKRTYAHHWEVSAFAGFADELVKQGAFNSVEQYLASLPATGVWLHFLPFLQGMLYVGSESALTEDEMNLVQALAEAFSTAYARYEDFTRLEIAKRQVEQTLTDLKQAQQQLVQSEKMASLGELTAGIAHEIQNPLNFVNNFSEVSNELLDEMKDELTKGNKDDAMQIAEDVKQNLEKINFHGKRADAIVKSMLQHSRSSSGQKELTDINALADEYLRLAYHGFRAKDKTFNARFETNLDNSIDKIEVVPQEMGRVILNLINNAFYAVTEKKRHHPNGYEPTVTVSTGKLGNKTAIRIKDNGNGIPQRVLDKIFQPFFTTKPTGQGTGLGLSLSYDIVKAHGGEIKVNTGENEGTEFTILLPA